MASIVSAGTTSATALNMSADTTGILQLASNNGTVGLTLDTSQNVGIGTALPSFGLSVEKDNGSGYVALFRKSVSDVALTIQTTGSITQIQGLNAALSATNNIAMQLSGGNVLIGGTSTTVHPALNKFVSLQSQTNNDVVGYALYVNEGTNSRRGSLFLDDNAGVFGLDVSAGSGVPNIVFRTAGTEHVRILSGDGSLLVGQTTNNFSTGNGVALLPSGRYLGTCTNDSTIAGSRLGSDGNVAAWYRGVTLVGQISVTASSCSFTNLSDYRVKENVTPLTNALSKISKLKPCTYTFKQDGSAGDGFIAHELAEVCPQAVTGEKDAVDAEGKPIYQGVDTSFLVATLTAAIQELNAKVTSLEEQVLNLGVK
jgi:hypothetical protein